MPLFHDENSDSPQLPKTSVSKVSKDASTTAIALLTAKDERVGATVFNNSNATLFLDFAQGVTSNDFAVAVPPKGYYELPYRTISGMWGVWSSTSGKALIREFIQA